MSLLPIRFLFCFLRWDICKQGVRAYLSSLEICWSRVVSSICLLCSWRLRFLFRSNLFCLFYFRSPWWSSHVINLKFNGNNGVNKLWMSKFCYSFVDCDLISLCRYWRDSSNCQRIGNVPIVNLSMFYAYCDFIILIYTVICSHEYFGSLLNIYGFHQYIKLRMFWLRKECGLQFTLYMWFQFLTTVCMPWFSYCIARLLYVRCSPIQRCGLSVIIYIFFNKIFLPP